MTAKELIRATGAIIVEQFEVPARPEQLVPIPQPYSDGAIGASVRKMANGDRLYRHQANALEYLDAGAHVVLNTGTASGKTLAFLAPIIRELLARPAARALLLYPQKALASDQLARTHAAVAAA